MADNPRMAMTRTLLRRMLAFTAIALCTGVLLNAQSFPLSEIEVTMTRHPHGCAPGCRDYTVTIIGNGLVRYNGRSPIEGTRTRTISVDDVVTLVNQMLRAYFFDAVDRYEGTSLLVRNGDAVELHGRGGSGPWADVTLRLGDRRKAVRLERDYPIELERLSEMIDTIGGPDAWTRK